MWGTVRGTLTNYDIFFIMLVKEPQKKDYRLEAMEPMKKPISQVREGYEKTGNKKGATIFNVTPCYCFGSGGWIRTNDLRVMSPTSYQTAPPRGNPVI